MPEYLAPGVYVEEVSYRTKSIEGVGTTTTAFVGPTRYGRLYDPPELLTSLNDFELAYGDGSQLDFADVGETDNYLWQAARAFFVEGGSMLYVKRIFRTDGITDGVARGTIPAAGGVGGISIAARYPGAAGDLHVRFTLAAGQNVLAVQKSAAGGPGSPPPTATPVVRGLNDRDVVLVTHSGLGSPPHPVVALASGSLDPASGTFTWTFTPVSLGHASPPSAIPLSALDPLHGDRIQVVTASVSVAQNSPTALPTVWSGLPLDQQHRLDGAPDALSAVFDQTSQEAQGTPIVINVGGADGVAVFETLLGPGGVAALVDPAALVDARSIDVILTGGNDGAVPQDVDYEGTEMPDDSKTGLLALEDIDEVSIVAAPGTTARYAVSDQEAQMAHAIINSLVAHAENMRYRIAVIDSGKAQTINDVRQLRAQFDSSWAAFYYPWVQILDPITGVANLMPPSGFVAGIYARNDVNRGVYKAPANEVITLAINFERPINKAQQEVLNPEGVNCLRFFEDRGYRIWGARTMSSDPEWTYVNLRRYFAFLEHSLDKGTQWAVFEPNGEALWANVRGTIDDFLFDQWQSGALLGDKAEQAYFVRCDRSTMTQNDLDNGRLVCEIGVAALRPAEFVIFRIGQWTGDATT
jgi:uncharacterized protein